MDPIDTDRFWKDGFIIIRDMFSQEEMAVLRNHAAASVSARIKGSSSGDILSNPDKEIHSIIYDDRIVSAATKILNGKPVYFGDSTLSHGSHHRGWHKDNRLPDRFNHSLADWSGKYTLIRFGVYLQDHSKHSGGLGVRVASHTPSKLVRLIGKMNIPFLGSLRSTRLKTKLNLFFAHNVGKAKNLEIETGDVVVWNQRTTHSGNAVRFKFASRFKFPTWFENKMPTWTKIPYADDRMAMFMTYGLDDDHLSRGIEFLKKRKYMINSWSASKIPESTLENIDSEKLDVRQPPKIPEDWKTTYS